MSLNIFKESIDDRLSYWVKHRTSLEDSQDPLIDVWHFWKDAPFVPYNNLIDPFNQFSWPSPWEIIVHNKYDDFTKALMIGWTLKLTKRFQNSDIVVKTLVDNDKNSMYNVVIIDDKWAINYNDNGPVSVEEVPDSFCIENLVKVKNPR